MLPDADTIAGVVIDTLAAALAPLERRLELLEGNHTIGKDALEALRGELVATRELVTHAAGLRELEALGDRVAGLEARPPAPGPPGPVGPAGQDGAPGLAYYGVHQAGKAYDRGAVVTWAGSAWACVEATTNTPGDGARGWILMVKRGRDGRDREARRG